MDKNIGQPRYGVIDRGVFGLRVVAGMVTGIRYTEGNPIYHLEMGKDACWTDKISDNPEGLLEFFDLGDLDRIKNTHGLKIKYGK